MTGDGSALSGRLPPWDVLLPARQANRRNGLCQETGQNVTDMS
jgi:hypothetical protein